MVMNPEKYPNRDSLQAVVMGNEYEFYAEMQQAKLPEQERMRNYTGQIVTVIAGPLPKDDPETSDLFNVRAANGREFEASVEELNGWDKALGQYFWPDGAYGPERDQRYLCNEKQDFERKVLNAKQMEQREALAEAEFAQYQFGDGISVSESDNWDKNDVADFTKIVYITCNDDAPDADSERVSFHVRFNADGTVDDAYGLLMRNGGDIGTRSANQAELNAMSETWSG